VIVRSDVPIDVGPDEARRAAERELARPEYAAGQPSLPVRVGRWLLRHIGELIDQAAQQSPNGYLGLIALFVVLVLILVAIRLRLGGIGRVTATPGVLFDRGALTAADHRRAADAHAAAEEWAPALRERLRAVVRELEERDLLEPRAGRTAAEVAVEAGRVLPSCAEQLRRAADSFADVWYGGRAATPEMDADLRDLDADARRAGTETRSGATR
jgi:hypothetical protein